MEVVQGDSDTLLGRIGLMEDMRMEWEQTEILRALLSEAPSSLVGMDEVCWGGRGAQILIQLLLHSQARDVQPYFTFPAHTLKLLFPAFCEIHVSRHIYLRRQKTGNSCCVL